MRVLFTGGCGFIGSHCIRLALSGDTFDHLVNLDSLTYSGQPMNLIDIQSDSRYSFVHGSINDFDLVSSIVKDYDIDAIVHLAAESHVDRSINSISEFVKTNVDGTRVLLEVVQKNLTEGKNIHFIHISTDEVYGSLGSKDAPFLESTPLSPMNPYSATKAASDMIVMAFINTYGISASITRCSNNYGPNQFPEKLIPLMIIKASSGGKLPIYGDGLQIRDWIHVSDHSRGILDVLSALHNGSISSGEVFNFGAENEMTNIQIVRKIISMVGASKNQIEFVKDRPGHDRRYAMGFAKAERILGWSPEVDWETGIKDTVEWYLSNDEWLESIDNGEYRDWISSHYGG